jgi:hypothetical protein
MVKTGLPVQFDDLPGSNGSNVPSEQPQQKKYDPLKRVVFELRLSIAHLDRTQPPTIGSPDPLAHQIAASIIVAAVGIRRIVRATIAVGITVGYVGASKTET